MHKFTVATKSRSRSCLRKVKTMDEQWSKHPAFRRLGTMNEFLEDRSKKEGEGSGSSCEHKRNLKQILRQKHPLKELNRLRRAKENERSIGSSQFSRMQTGIEDSQEGSEREETATESHNEEPSQAEPGHYKFTIGQLIKNRYQVIKHICDGTFGRVLEVEDVKDKKKTHYALKVIRPVERYIEAAKEEAEILRKLPKNSHIIPLIETFYHKHHYCIMTRLYGSSLASFLEKNDYQGYPLSTIQSIGRQLIKTLKLIHELSLTHTDLKPENILLFDDSYTSYGKYKAPDNDKIVLIDFGNATFAEEHHSRVINTREYRAPEVLLQCCQWSEISDMWAVGCILCELYNGECLFGGMHGEGEQDLGLLEHLTRIQKLSGPIPPWMAEHAPQPLQDLLFKRNLRSNRNQVALKTGSLLKNNKVMNNIKEMLVIKDIIDPNYPELIDLVQKLCCIDPNKRISADQALKHPFFLASYQ